LTGLEVKSTIDMVTTIRERVPALVLYSRRVPGTRAALVETLGSVLRALPTLESGRPRWPGKLFSWLDRNAYTSLSYVIDWLDAFRRSPLLDAKCINISNLSEWPHAVALIRKVPLVVVLHSAAGDDLSLVAKLGSRLAARRGRMLLFFGNEYSLMREKIAFARATGTDFIASQLPPATAAWLYGECECARLLHAPAALNPRRYHPLPVMRNVDIGFRGDLYPHFIGDDERTRILEYFRLNSAAHGLSADIHYARLAGSEWHAFLARCRGIVGAEAGTYYLERDDRTADAVARYVKDNPFANFEEVYERFFENYPRGVSGKAVSSRHFEAAGTRTCQMLLEGNYNGIFDADTHYLGVKRDMSNVSEVIERFKDQRERERIASQAYDHVIERHTYDRRVFDLLSAVLE
jgi:hypothetical protein